MDIVQQKQNIILILDHAVSKSARDGFKGVRASLTPGELYAKTIRDAIIEKINKKKNLFINIPQESESYKSILESAKLSLTTLQNKSFDFNCLELINKFLSIDYLFANNLKFVGIREYEDYIKVIKQIPEPVKYNSTKPEINIGEKVSGKKLVIINEYINPEILKQANL